MKVFLDTNIVIDLLGKREPFFTAAAEIATLAVEKRLEIVVSSVSFSYHFGCGFRPTRCFQYVTNWNVTTIPRRTKASLLGYL